ncbi:sigma-70 family RNA polymerase sigma factor [Amycolatopsis japonica]|uniref:sigma-70 family RNA polymerase sigma factor n=1 Tax=Amycolatopsis japonica TaxID=208439 RepID=UPI0033C9E795
MTGPRGRRHRMSTENAVRSDAELIKAVRAGRIEDYGQLYERHSGAASNLARQLARSDSEAEDLVSDAFAKVLDTLRQGKGPDAAFRAYLLTALRHTAYDNTRRNRRVTPTDDMESVAVDTLAVPLADATVAGLERTLAARAFARLPERWQDVLWHIEIEGQTPAEVAPLLGLTPNGVSAMAYRAREGLRQAFLEVHLQENLAPACQTAAGLLGAWAREGLAKKARFQVDHHLDECEACRTLAAELRDVNTGLRGIIAPIVLGGAALGYLATASAKAATAATATGATATAGTAGSAASMADPAGISRQFRTAAGSATVVGIAVVVALSAAGQPAEPPLPVLTPTTVSAPALPAPASPAPAPVPLPTVPSVPSPTPAPKRAPVPPLGPSPTPPPPR